VLSCTVSVITSAGNRSPVYHTDRQHLYTAQTVGVRYGVERCQHSAASETLVMAAVIATFHSLAVLLRVLLYI